MARAPSNIVYLESPEKGVDGRGILTLARDPVISDGRIGDFILQTVTKKLYGPKNAGGWPDLGLIRGAQGWAPKLVAEADGTRRVFKISDWTGGEGVKPATGYLAADGTVVAEIEDAADFRGVEGPQALINALDTAADPLLDETLIATGAPDEDNVKRAAVELFDLGAVIDRRSVAHAQASLVRPDVKLIRTQFYAPSYTEIDTLVGGASYRRVNSEPPHAGKFRTLDRWTAEGNFDSANGGWWGLSVNSVTPQMFGAKGNGVSDDRLAIQRALGVGLPVDFPKGIYLVGLSGSTIGGRAYGVLIPSGATMLGSGSSDVVIKAAALTNMDVVTTLRASASVDITIKGITVDGNEASQTDGGFNYYLRDVTGLVLDDVRSKNSGLFGVRIDTCDRVWLDQAFANHSAESNSDGIHFIDTRNVSIGTVQVYTEGDDAFIIEATNRDVFNYAIGQIIVTAPASAVSAAKRGLAIFADPSLVSASPLISNINVASLVANDCVGAAIALSGASFEDIRIQAIAKKCRSFMSAYPGHTSYIGHMKRCSFTGEGSDFANRAIDTGAGSGNIIVGNHIDVLLSDPGDGTEGVVLIGDEWSGSVRLDYDPNNDKASPSFGVVIHGSDNDLSISAKGAHDNLYLRSTAQNNNIKLGFLKGADVNDLMIQGGAANNRFSGGRIAGAISNSAGSSNTYENVAGATIFSRINMDFSIAADGTYVWNHGLKGAPSRVLATLNTVANVFHLQVQAVSATTITFKMWNTAGAVITNGTYQAYVEARL